MSLQSSLLAPVTPVPAPLTSLTIPNEKCDGLRDPNFIQLIVSSLIIVGLLLSYLPQHHRIISRRTSEGISPWFVILGTTSATAGLANVLTVGPSRVDMVCCRQVETFECVAGMLGIVQLGVQEFCFGLILVLYIIFFPYNDISLPQDETMGKTNKNKTPIWVGSICLVHAIIVGAISVTLALSNPDYLDNWANLLGVMAACVAAIQYLPQIWTTYRLKHIGSLSIPMMLIQTPGGLLFAASLFARLGWEGWSTWGIFVVTSFMQGALLSLGIYFELTLRRNQQLHRDHGAVTPTLSHGNNRSYGSTANGHATTNGITDGEISNHESTAPPPPTRVPRRRPRGPSRAYSEGFEEGLPGPYTAHAASYADTPEELEGFQAREERQIARDETRPLLKPGGIGNSNSGYESDKST